MNGRKLCMFFGILVALLFLGCQEGIKITVKDPGDRSPTFILEPLSVLGWNGVEITAFYLAEYSADGGVKRIIWRIESVDMKPRQVHEIKFGIVPDGFREISPPQELIPGYRYEVGAGMPGKVGYLSYVPENS